MSDHPRVTLAVVAYNQEKFIEEAIAGALTQDYPNLQIVLSDDGSSDRTVRLMEGAVAAYTGRHAIVINRRSGQKLGILSHLLDAAGLADGELFVGAAGDDISLPHRVSTLVEHWQRERPAVIYTAWNRVDITGRFLSRDGISGQNDRDLAAYFPNREVRAAFGCTTAYSMKFLRTVQEPQRPIWAEDYFLSCIAMLAGETIAYIDEPLVSYRQNPAALRNFASRATDFRAYEERENRFFSGLVDLLQSLLDVVDSGAPPALTRVDRTAIERDIAWYRYRSEWSQQSLPKRLGYTASLRSSQRLRWAVPRMIGLSAFIRMKSAGSLLRRQRATGAPK